MTIVYSLKDEQDLPQQQSAVDCKSALKTQQNNKHIHFQWSYMENIKIYNTEYVLNQNLSLWKC